MIFDLKVALRFLKEGKGQTLFILLGIAVGVAVQIFLNTLITGLQADLINQTVGGSAHIFISGKSEFNGEAMLLPDWQELSEIIASQEGIKHVSPSVDGNGFIINNDDTVPVILKGVQLNLADPIYTISTRLVDGTTNLDGTRILIGKGISEEYNLQVNDVIGLNLANGTSQKYTISGIFDLGNGISNDSWVIMDMGQAQKLLQFGTSISRLELQINEVFDAKVLDDTLEARLASVEVGNWIDNNVSLLAALQSQSASSIMIQAFVLLAVTLGIASVLAVSVVQKSKQLGILKAMGTRNAIISRIFLLQGLLLGILGSALGTAIGIGLIEGFLWGTSISTGVPLFPLQVDATSTGIIMLIATISCTIAALIPAKSSSKLNAVEVIRNG